MLLSILGPYTNIQKREKEKKKTKKIRKRKYFFLKKKLKNNISMERT